MSALVSVSAATVDTILIHAAFIAALTFLLCLWVGRVGWYLICTWLDRVVGGVDSRPVRAQYRDDTTDLADSLQTPPYVDFDAPEIAPQDEPVWDGKAPHRPGTRRLFALAEPVVVIGGNPARFDLTGFAPASGALSAVTPETASEISGRHALIPPDSSTTGVMPAVVDDEGAMAVLAVVSGGDGAA